MAAKLYGRTKHLGYPTFLADAFQWARFRNDMKKGLNLLRKLTYYMYIWEQGLHLEQGFIHVYPGKGL